jgi:hypothetical protein
MSRRTASPSAPPLTVTSRGGGPTDPSHDAELRRGIIHTAVTRPVAAALVVVFFVCICGVPIAQAVLEKVTGDDSMLRDLFRRAPTRQNLKQFEEDLEKSSYLKEAVQPRMQLLLTRFGRVGNKRAVVGRDGWLFYQPGVLSVAGPGFLDPDTQRARQKAALDDADPAWSPDPRPAVLALHQALVARGIRLVLFPVTDKAALQPRQLHGRRVTAVASNRDYPRFVAEMRSAGVLVFDPVPATLRPDEAPRFLEQDTHWTPDWMEAAAVGLAALVRDHGALPPVPAPRWRTSLTAVERVGDIVDMLKLPDGQTLFAPQKIVVRRVQDEKGEPWQPKPSADVLLLGDSFSNVFSLGAMGWGEAAGLAPRLAIALGRDVDVIAQNDSGAFATRKLLSEALVAGEDPLAGKRVVIWELASRELAVGDWKPYSFRRPAEKAPR